MNRITLCLCLLVCVLAAPSATAGQGVQAGEIRGVVTDPSGAVAPGVAISITSSALQGERSTITDAQGGYAFRGLLPGTYAATFLLSGFSPAERILEMPLGSVLEVNVTLTAGPVAEQVTVVGQSENAVRQPEVSTNLTKDLVDLLPIGRSPYGIAAQMPGLTTNTPNGGQLTISGAFAYDNVFLVDGTDVNDNLFGTADPLYIADAIAETQVLTGGISAAYGRFSGGVVNVISKQGGNTFSGSFRDTWTNPKWTGRNPFEKANDAPRTDTLNAIHEGTFGGPLVRDRFWFFTAGLFQSSDMNETFPQTAIPYVAASRDARGQIKLTATVGAHHTFSGQYLNSSGRFTGPAFEFTIDPAAVMRARYPAHQFVTYYHGAIRPKAFVEVQYSQKHSGFRGAGGTSSNIFDSPIINPSPLAAYNAPYFDASDPEDRDNKQLTGSVAYLLSKWGLHDVRSGAEYFRTTNRGGNSQTATGYVFSADYLSDASGKPLLDDAGRLIPLFVPGDTNIQNWLPVRGAAINIRTVSLYASDSWSLDRHWSLDVGTRFEAVGSDATGGVVGIDTHALVPRLAVSFDPRGTGAQVFQATYDHYAGKYGEAQFSSNSNVANPDVLSGIYVGPPGAGRNFAPGFDPANYILVDGSFPTANVFFDKHLSSPITKEFTLQAGSRIGRQAYVKAIYQNRRVTNFVEDFVTLDTGTTMVSKSGVSDIFSNIVYRNSNLPKRRYQALQFVSRYNPLPRWTWNAAWTIQLKNEGNFEGEASNQPGISSPIGEYPEAFNEARTYPIGRLASFERYAVRVWSIYSVGPGRFGRVDVAGFYTLDSGLTYSLRAGGQPLSAVQRALLAGYVSQPASQTIYFGPRGSQDFTGYGLFDLAVNYSVPIFKSLRPWLKVEIYNLFNNDKLVTWNTTVVPDPGSALDNLGLRTGYIKGPLFGQAQSSGNYLPARSFRMAFGVRF